MSAFCQAVEARRRCVAPAGHIGKHDFQPLSSASVRAITRQESEDEKLAGMPKALLAQEAASSTRLDGETIALPEAKPQT